MVRACAGGVAGFTVEQVEEVRMVVRMLPIFLTTIFFWTIYSQARACPLPACAPLSCLAAVEPGAVPAMSSPGSLTPFVSGTGGTLQCT